MWSLLHCGSHGRFPGCVFLVKLCAKDRHKKKSCLDFNSCYLQNTWKGGRCGLVIHVSAASGALVWLTIEGLLYRKTSKLLRKLVALGFASKTLAAWWWSRQRRLCFSPCVHWFLVVPLPYFFVYVIIYMQMPTGGLFGLKLYYTLNLLLLSTIRNTADAILPSLHLGHLPGFLKVFRFLNWKPQSWQ